MGRPEVSEEDIKVETWETNVAGSTFVYKYNSREDIWHKVNVGKGGRRQIQVSVDERKYNHNMVDVDNVSLDPFLNGRLRKIAGAVDESLDLTNQLTSDQMKAIAEMGIAAFKKKVTAITSELTIRQLIEVCDEYATVKNLSFIKEYLQEKWPLGGEPFEEVILD